MRVLILSCNTGEGHNSCAKAIKEVYDARGDDCVIRDSLQFISDGFSKFMSNWHTRIYRYLPGLFRVGYRYSEKHPGVFQKSSVIYKVLTRGTDRMRRAILDGEYDAVICVHVLSALLLTRTLEEHPMELRTAFVATDYTCSPMVQETKLDRYFIPHSSLAHEFECPNIPLEKIVESGIPIRQMFYGHTDKAAAKEAVGVKRGNRHLLMMCGSMGCGPMEHLTELLSRSDRTDFEISIICGTNEKLRHKLEGKYGGDPRLHVHGFVEDMGMFMDSADLYLTKPGGLSVTEAAVKHLPMVYIDTVAGCEAPNLEYFVRMGGAKTGADAKELALICRELLADEAELNKMEKILSEHTGPNASRCICSVMS